MTLSNLPSEPAGRPAVPLPEIPAAPAPVTRTGVVARFGVWLGRQPVSTIAVPPGLWLLVNALLGRYTVSTGLLGALMVVASAGPPRDTDGEEEGERGESRRLRRIMRLLQGTVWLASPVVFEWWWFRNLPAESGAWIIGLLVAAYVAMPFLRKLDQRYGGHRRPVLGAGARVATVLAGSVTAMAGMVLTIPERMPSAAGGILLMLLGGVMVVMGGLGLPTVRDEPRRHRLLHRPDASGGA